MVDSQSGASILASEQMLHDDSIAWIDALALAFLAFLCIAAIFVVGRVACIT